MSFLGKLAALWRRRSLDAEISEEFEAHLAFQTEENAARGMDLAAARDAALRSFGGVEQLKEQCRDERVFTWLAQIQQDFGYAARSLRKQPGFAAAAVVTLAIGIGINAHVFTIVNDLVIRPFLHARDDNLVAIRTRQIGGERDYRAFSWPEYRALCAATDVFRGVAAMRFVGSLVGREQETERRFVCLVSRNYFSVLGVRPLRGRFFSAEEADPANDETVMVASYELWRRMGGRDDFVGSRLRIERTDFTVIGIAPEGFGGLHWSIGPDAWLPLGASRHLVDLQGLGPGGIRGPRSFVLEPFAALRPGMSLAAARRMLPSVSDRLNELDGAGSSDRQELSIGRPPHANFDLTWPSDESGLVIYPLAAMGMTLTVLLVACVNVANMLLGRGIARRKEIAIRLCLGASRGRVIRQLLVEGLFLALLGGAVGLALSGWSYTWMNDVARRQAGMMTLTLHGGFGWAPLLATFGFCLVATVAFALVPAVRATRLNLVDDLKQQGGDSAPRNRWNRFFSLRHCLVMAQMALSVALLFSSGLLVHAVINTQRDRGFATDRRLIANVDYTMARTPPADIPRRQRALLTRLAGVPGVGSVALASGVPLNFEPGFCRVYPAGSAAIPGTDVRGAGGAVAGRTLVSDGYFANMGIALLRGRDFTAAEAREGAGRPVAVIDESLGRALFGDQDPLGRYFAMSRSAAAAADRRIEIVGVIRSPREDAFQNSTVFKRIYRPYAQVAGGLANTYIHLKLAPGAVPSATAIAIRRELHTLDPETPILACGPLDSFLAKNLNTMSVGLITALFGFFGAVAVVLAGVGVYGVKAYAVARRTREIGIRIAVGAQRTDVLGLLLRQTVLQTCCGVAAGAVLAVLTGQFLSRILYHVSAADGSALTVAFVVVTSASLVAGLVPTLRAAGINPAEALRVD